MTGLQQGGADVAIVYGGIVAVVVLSVISGLRRKGDGKTNR
jgi:hypothetical protein